VSGYALRLRGIRFVGSFGASRAERATSQEIVVDVDLDLPLDALPKQDRREDVFDYDRVVRLVVEEGVREPIRLLETYVARVVDRFLAGTPVRRVRVAARKAHAPTTYPVDEAIVEIVRVRRDSRIKAD
jgi:dihydroneopterin aldolase